MLPDSWTTALLFVIEELIRLGFSIRVIMRRLPVGVSLAWLAIILIFPFAGAAVYLVLGEYRLGRRRQSRIKAIQQQWELLMEENFPAEQDGFFPDEPETVGLARLARSLFNAPVSPGNGLELLEDADCVFSSLVQDIDQAEKSCDFQFYIWAEGGRVEEVAAALTRAAARGVRCRILLDSVGSGEFLRGESAKNLRTKGVEIREALHAGLMTAPFVRPDLRLHRKIVTIDGRVGYTGSMNMVDPRYFKQTSGVGQWVDAMARITGPAVFALTGNFIAAWSVETDTEPDVVAWGQEVSETPRCGPANIQVLPSGPGTRPDAIEQVLVTAIYAAAREITLTTPYFVPTESLLTSILSAAGSGVKVTLIVPAEVDSILVGYASQAFQTDLVEAGVRVALYEGGLLHTKSITIDDHLSLFGSINLDPRSLKLNFEITLAIYDEEFNLRLKQLQAKYLAKSCLIDLQTCRSRSTLTRFVENSVRLMSPVL